MKAKPGDIVRVVARNMHSFEMGGMEIRKYFHDFEMGDRVKVLHLMTGGHYNCMNFDTGRTYRLSPEEMAPIERLTIHED